MADEVTLVVENGVHENASESPLEPEQSSEQREPTLTDRLNKRLLESFLTRLEQGSFEVPSTAHSDSSSNDLTRVEEESNEFEDWTVAY